MGNILSYLKGQWIDYVQSLHSQSSIAQWDSVCLHDEENILFEFSHFVMSEEANHKP